MEIPNFIKNLKNLDESFFEKNFLEILLNFYQNDNLIIFLNTQKESETRDLIDGLFDECNDENFIIELKDINSDNKLFFSKKSNGLNPGAIAAIIIVLVVVVAVAAVISLAHYLRKKEKIWKEKEKISNSSAIINLKN